MRLIGIDYGKRNIGVSLSNEEGRMAFPVSVLNNDTSLVSSLEEICRNEKVGGIVLGESLDFEGKPNPIMKKILSFKKQLEEKLDLPVYFEPEFMTTKEASHIQGKGSQIDASAATIILQSFLDKNKDKLNQ